MRITIRSRMRMRTRMRKEKRVKKKLKMRTRKDEEDLKQHVGLSDSSYVDMIYWTSYNGRVRQTDDIAIARCKGDFGREKGKNKTSQVPGPNLQRT